MPAATQLPCDGDGKCMLCGVEPSEAERLDCKTCGTPWHAQCLIARPESLASTLQWECPDCSEPTPAGEAADTTSAPASLPGSEGELRAAIRAIDTDESLSEQEKAKKRQELLMGNSRSDEVEKRDDNDILAVLGEHMSCSFCMQLPEKPITTPCGHNFCLKCFEKWVREGKKTCAKCRKVIPSSTLSQPRINSALVLLIRNARVPKAAKVVGSKYRHFVHNSDLPDKAFTTENAKKTGKANAKSGRIFVTIPSDHLGPITAEHDPVNNTGVLVGDSWEDRLACRQWGAHFPHVSGIAGQSSYGAQSVVLSGGYQDDEDHGEWFLYTGSGGRDLSGNKRTNKTHSSHQKFTSGNEALRFSCRKGYPVRVVRSHKEKRSHYAPPTGVRYDGIYRIEKCWRKTGQDGYLVCRYLFVRCDNSPAPWTSDDHGDRPRPQPNIPELKNASDLTVRKDGPHWDFDETEECWKWMKPPPCSQKAGKTDRSPSKRSKKSSRQKIMREFGCLICHKLMTHPVTTPCAHNFCKPCLDGKFTGHAYMKERKTGGRQLRTQKNVMKCPSCSCNIADFLQDAQVNTEMMGVIESLKKQWEEEDQAAEVSEEEDDDGEEPEEGDAVNGNDEGSSETKAENGNVECNPLVKEERTKRKAESSDGTNNAVPPSKRGRVKT